MVGKGAFFEILLGKKIMINIEVVLGGGGGGQFKNN